MGLGPSIKMTTLHHYNCPVTREMLPDTTIDFAGVLLDGVSENYSDKIRTAEETGRMAAGLRADGAVVAIDGWGNHHIDFTEVIRSLGEHGIPSVGLSYIGQQGRLVCSNPYVGTIIDFNKEASGYETCCVGQNNLTEDDAFKAVEILKHQVKRMHHPARPRTETSDLLAEDLTRVYLPVRSTERGARTAWSPDGRLVLRKDIGQDLLADEPRIKGVHVDVLPPDRQYVFVNSNLDIQPIAVKAEGSLGSGRTLELQGIRAMLNGVEDVSGFQPANIGSSEGILSEHVYFDRAGTPAWNDRILHIDFLFREGEGRTAEGIEAAHRIADRILQEIRDAMLKAASDPETAGTLTEETFSFVPHPGKMRLILLKISSGLGNMYDTAVMPDQPGGILGAQQMRLRGNSPVFFTPLQILDGAIHTLL